MTATTATDILSQLNGVRKTAAGWQACCPAHDDNTASLAVSIGDDGRLLLHCHANCETADVVRALGLTMADLMPRTNGRASGGFEIATTYDYRNAQGDLLYQAVRMIPKDFRQRTPKPGGGWNWKLNGARRVLYHLPELAEAEPGATAYIVEGEKDVDALRALGLLATCNVGGAGKWRAEYAESLRGFHAIVLPDNDQTGRDHAEAVTNSLPGIAASVKLVNLPNLPDKGDVSDWLAAGGTLETLAGLVAEAPEWVPTKAARKPRRKVETVTTSDPTTDLRAVSARTDTANARRFAILHGENVRWCDPWGKWLGWDGRRWSPDAERRIDAMGKEVGQAVWNQTAILLPDLDYATCQELTSFARTTASARGIGNLLSLAKSEPGIPILPDKLDADPWALNCANGTVDLRTGKLRSHRRADLLTTFCPTDFIAGSTCPLWEQAIGRIFAGNADLCGFVKRLLGSAIVGTVVEHIFPIFWGDGSNGKGLFLETIMDVLGNDFACKIGADVLLATKGDRHPTELADLHGKRLVVASETDDGRRLREGLLKEITGGDTIKARRMREDFWQFRPSHTLLLLTNHRPTVRGTDHGIWRRLCLVPFVQKFWDADRGEHGPAELRADKSLRDKLRAEHSGILCWLVDGCLEWQANGLKEPTEVRTATAEYRTSQDVVGAFIADRCVEGNAFTAKASAVYAAYAAWCKAAGEHPVNQRRFGGSMTERGIERYRSDGTWYRGLGLVSEGSEQSDPSF